MATPRATITDVDAGRTLKLSHEVVLRTISDNRILSFKFDSRQHLDPYGSVRPNMFWKVSLSARREAKVAARLANEIVAFERSSGERVPIGAYGFVISAGTMLGQGIIAVSFRAIHLVEKGRETHQLPVEHMGRQEDVNIARLELEGPRGVLPRNVVAVKVNESARDADTWLLGSNQGAAVLDDLLLAVRAIIARRDDPSL